MKAKYLRAHARCASSQIASCANLVHANFVIQIRVNKIINCPRIISVFLRTVLLGLTWSQSQRKNMMQMAMSCRQCKCKVTANVFSALRIVLPVQTRPNALNVMLSTI